MENIVIIGTGQAGGWAARTLRDKGFAGRIRLFGDEAYPPYERPPLSKDVMQGLSDPGSTFLWSPETTADLNIDLHLGVVVKNIDRAQKKIVLADGTHYLYDRLLLATGSRVRRLDVPGASNPNVHYLRGIDDALAIKAALVPGSRLLVVGGGWIGLEVAASARQLDVDVVVTDISSHLCARVLPENLARFLMQQHEAQGVRFLLNTTVERFSGQDKAMLAYLSNGDILPVSTAVIGIGVIPNTELAIDAGLTVDNGIVVDEYGRTLDEAIFSAGDVANQPHIDGRVRHESWANAQNHAIATAASMLDASKPYSDIPWFWSDQYEINMQILGSLKHADEVVTRGNAGAQQFTQFFLRKGRIAGAVGINKPQDISVAKRLMQRGFVTTSRQLLSVPTLQQLL